MGLDMWLVMKTDKMKNNKFTGVANGLFGTAPAFEDGTVEVGYWRNARDQQDLIRYHISKTLESNVGNFKGEISLEETKAIIKEAKKYRRKRISDDDSEFSTFNNHGKWKNTVKFFKLALKIFKKDHDAKLYYYEWY